jgi:hypothetical protein
MGSLRALISDDQFALDEVALTVITQRQPAN